jgi:hypothetical protein
MTTTQTKPVIGMDEIPLFFDGGWPECHGTLADTQFDSALNALVALTGRGDKDPAVHLIVRPLEDALGDLINAACEWGRCIPDGMDSAVDNMDDDVLFDLTGYRRKPVTPQE